MTNREVWKHTILLFFSTSLHRKWMLVITLLVMVIIGTISTLWSEQQKNEASARIENKATFMSKLLVQTLTPSLWAVDLKSMEKQLDTLMEDPELYSIAIYDIDSDRPLLEKKREEILVEGTRRSVPITYDLNMDKIDLGKVEIVYSHQLLNQQIFQLRLGMLLGAFFVFLVLSGAIYITSSHMVEKPVKTVVNQMNRIAAGDFESHLKAPSYDEIGQLMEACNQMANRLSESRTALQASEQRYRSLFEEVPAGLYRVSSQGQFIEANQTLVLMLRYTNREALVNHNLADLFVRSQDFLQWKIQLERYETAQNLEAKFYCADKTTLWMQHNSQVVKDKLGHTLYIEGSLQNITQRKEIEETLNQERTLLSNIMKTSPISIVTTDANGQINFANPQAERLLGLTKKEITQRDYDSPLWHITDLEGNPILSQDLPFARVMATHQPVYNVQQAIQHSNGQPILLSINAAPLIDEYKVLKGMVATLENITERIEAENTIRQMNIQLEQRVEERTAQLSNLNQELEAFSYSVSHDLRAPLRAIQGFSQSLLEDLDPQLAPQAQEYLTRIVHASRQMAQLIEDLLKLSRITRSELRTSEINLSRLIEETFEEMHSIQPERDVQLSIQPGLSILADPGMMRIFTTNLLGNAWKFTRDRHPARIEAGSFEKNGALVYFIRDNGVGFDMKYASRLFTAFQRLHNLSEFEGNGIGLAIVQRIIHRHGGHIWAESSPDQGATFYFQL